MNAVDQATNLSLRLGANRFLGLACNGQALGKSLTFLASVEDASNAFEISGTESWFLFQILGQLREH